MKEIKDKEKIEKYILKSGFKENFSFDLSDYVKAYAYKSGESIVKQGEENSYLYYLVNGRVKVYLLMEDGRFSLLEYLKAPCFLGELELLNNGKNTSTVKADYDIVCLRIKLDEVREILEKDVRFYKSISIYLSNKFVQSQRVYLKSLNYPLKNRLAAFILLSEREGYYKEKHTEVAEYLGVSYRHLLYTFEELVKTGILERRKRYLYIKRREELNKLGKIL